MTEPLPIPSPATRALLEAHARDLAEQADRHAVVLESLLAVLRSRRLDDRAARTTAIDTAAAALVAARTRGEETRNSIVEPVVGAFARLTADLRPLVRYGDLDLQFVEPPPTGRALPGDVANAARAIVRTAVLALVDAGEARRVRIQWDCDGLNLLIRMRDDGRGEVTRHDDALRPIMERVTSLNGVLQVESTAGWGSSMAITIPLDAPPPPEPIVEDVQLSAREREVAALLLAGERNAAIAETLGVSANTVKFHVSNVLRKTGVTSRTELLALHRAASV
ncbi:LuxR C-terminal-related transcriptional regulator [Microbacteriaceae bacterium 4G12]